MCVVLFGPESHDFFRWKTSRQIYKQILALKEFPQSCFLFRRRLKNEFELLFHCLRLRSLPTPFCEFFLVLAIGVKVVNLV